MLNQTIQLGPLNLPWFILIFLSAYLAGSFLVKKIKGLEKKSVELTERHIPNTFLIGFLIWKLSPLVFSFSTIKAEPLALLYLPGGNSGAILGIISGLAYLGFYIFKAGAKRPAFLKSSGVYLILMGITGGLTLLILVIFSSPTSPSETAESAVIRTGIPAPDFILTDMNGTDYAINEQRGRWVILNFWATWCPPCRAELPELSDFYRVMEEEEVRFLGINLTTSEKNPSDIPGFIIEHNIDFPVLLDSSGSVSRLYSIQSIPTTIIIDPGGIIRDIKTGVVSRGWIEQRIQ